MATHKHIERICLAAVLLAVLLAVLFLNAERLGISLQGKDLGYEDRIFDASVVHTIDIQMDDWDSFLDTCIQEVYSPCTVVIDGESYGNVGIRGKGNTSLSNVASMDSQRYSFKLEFDQYDSGMSYYGLDKLSLNNIIQDNTYMKDFLVYQWMAQFGVDAPLCSYVNITVNGEDWGLYLAVEGVEEAFLQRNYGGTGNLYKPDSMDIGGGGMGGSEDVKLQYIDDDPASYPNIFDNAKTDVTEADQTRLITALEKLSSGEDIDATVDVEEVLRYFVVHNFVVNDDSYTGSMIHNYYLYEKDGKLAMIPWDYNLAFGGFGGEQASGAVNDPIDDVLEDRPMQAWIFSNEAYTQQYHALYAAFLQELHADAWIQQTADLIAPYVEKDPTKFCTYDEYIEGVEALKTFCTLRTESVQGQLSGTIPSTTQGQEAEPEALVSADGLSVAAMGTMTNGGMGGGPGGGMGFGGRGEAPTEEAQTLPNDEGFPPREAPPDGENFTPGEMPQGRGNFAPNGAQPDDPPKRP